MLVRMSMLSAIVVGMGLGVCVFSAAGEEKPAPPEKPRGDDIRKLIEQLSAESFKVREEATRQLMERDDALSMLREVAKSDDAEMRRRSQKAMEAINKRLGKRAIQRAIAKLKKGQTDQFVDAVVQWREYMDEDGWKAAVDHVHAIADEASKVSGGQYKLAAQATRRRNSMVPWDNVAKLSFVHTDHLKLPDKTVIRRKRIVAESVAVPDGFIHDSFLLCAGPVTSKYSLGGTVLFVNGDVRIGSQEETASLGGSIVVCDGNVDVSGQVGGSVILARGNVTTGAFVKDSVIISGGNVKVGTVFPDAFVRASVIQEHKKHPLNVIHFFDCGQMGIEVKSSTKEARVEAVMPTKLFRRAGLCGGDEVTALNGVKVDSVENFRQLLRRGMQEEEPVILELRREGKPLRLEVRGADAP